MGAHFELFATLLINVRALYNREGTFAGGQRNGTGQAGASAQGRINYLLRCLVDYLVVVSLQANTDPLLNFGWFGVCHRWCSFLNLVQSAVTSLCLTKVTFSQQ